MGSVPTPKIITLKCDTGNNSVRKEKSQVKEEARDGVHDKVNEKKMTTEERLRHRRFCFTIDCNLF